MTQFGGPSSPARSLEGSTRPLPEGAASGRTSPFPCKRRKVRNRRSAEAHDLPTDFRSPLKNGHSPYGHLTARFARFRSIC